jgi:hypothetical protein
MLSSFTLKQKLIITKYLKKGYYGLWSKIKEKAGDKLEGKSRVNIWYCAQWLVKHDYYKLQKGDETRGTESRDAENSMRVGRKAD